MKSYTAVLKCDGQKVAETMGENKKFVAETICHYLAQYIDEGENFDVKIKYKEWEKKDVEQ